RSDWARSGSTTLSFSPWPSESNDETGDGRACPDAFRRSGRRPVLLRAAGRSPDRRQPDGAAADGLSAPRIATIVGEGVVLGGGGRRHGPAVPRLPEHRTLSFAGRLPHARRPGPPHPQQP